jgi:hypothetical protein
MTNSCTLAEQQIPRSAGITGFLPAIVVEVAENIESEKRRRAATLLKVDGALVVEER